MSMYRNRQLFREGFEGGEEAELLTAPSAVAIAIDESLNVRNEVEAEANYIEELSDSVEIGESDIETLDAMEDSLEDESREVTEEEAETIKLVTEGFANRYGFDMPRTLATESFGANGKDNRELALKYVREARLGTENFVSNTISDLITSFTEFFNVLRHAAVNVRKHGHVIREMDPKRPPGRISGDSYIHLIQSRLSYNYIYKGDDPKWMADFAKANLNCSETDFTVDKNYITDLVSFLEKNPNATANPSAVVDGIPSINKFYKAQAADFKAIGMEGNSIPVLGHETISFEEHIMFGALGMMFLPLQIIAIDATRRLRSSKIGLIGGKDAKVYGQLMIDIGDGIEKSKLLDWDMRGGKGGFIDRANEQKKIIKESPMSSEARKLALKFVNMERKMMVSSMRIRVTNMRCLAYGLIDMAVWSLR